MKYRAEVDGLRAVAVLVVIAFHAGFAPFGGGFVGVDVFFVISGYLITSIIKDDLQRGSFSLTNFYERRARRILPALFVVAFACLPFAWQWLLPQDLKDFGQSLMAVATFSSNILFWLESGYFDTAADFKPLLHTWSLAVEEQFYLFFPLLLLVIWRSGQKVTHLALLLIFCLSFALAQWGSINYPDAAFYLLPSRIWELLVGAFIALGIGSPAARSLNKSIRNLLGAIGLLMVLMAAMTYDHSTPFPGVYALLPVMGTALILLFATASTWVGKLLSTRVLVGVGLISYSAYLWHQPIFALLRHRSLNEPVFSAMLLGTVMALLLGYVSWRWVEQPFRRHGTGLTRKRLLLCSIVATSSLLLIGFVGHRTDISQAPSIRVGDVQVSVPQRFKGHIRHGEPCSPADFSAGPCRLDGGNDAGPTVVLLGDSHAVALSQALLEQRDSYRELIDLSAGGCPFLPRLATFFDDKPSPCTVDYQQQRLEFIASLRGDLVFVLSSRLPWYYHKPQFNNNVGAADRGLLSFASKRIDSVESDRKLQIQASLREAVTVLQSKGRFIAVLPTHENGWDPGKRLHRMASLGFSYTQAQQQLQVPLDTVLKWGAPLESALRLEAAKYRNVYLVDPKTFTCDWQSRTFSSLAGGELLFSDDDHLALSVNRKVANQVVEIIARKAFMAPARKQ